FCNAKCTTLLVMSRPDTLQLRLTPEEKQAFESASEVSGVSLSAWARERLRMAATQELHRNLSRAHADNETPDTSDAHPVKTSWKLNSTRLGLPKPSRAFG